MKWYKKLGFLISGGIVGSLIFLFGIIFLNEFAKINTYAEYFKYLLIVMWVLLGLLDLFAIFKIIYDLCKQQ